MLRLHIIKGNLLIISYFIFLVFMVTCFFPKHNKCLKMGLKCQIFASSRTTMPKFSDLKHYDGKRNSKKWGHSVH